MKKFIYELNKIVEMENKLNRDYLIYKTSIEKKDRTFGFQMFKAIWSFEKEIYNNELSLNDVLKQQIRQTDHINNFKESAKPKELVRRRKKSTNS